MELYQRKSADGSLLSPFYYYDMTLPDGTRSRRSTRQRTKIKAQAAMVQALREAEDEAKAGPKSITLREALQGYAKLSRSKGKDAAMVDRMAEKTFAMGVWAERGVFGLPASLSLDKLSEEHIATLVDARRAEGLKTGSIAQELKTLRAAVMSARARGAAVAPVRWNVPTAPGKTRWLSQDEWQRVYEALDPLRPVPHKGGGHGEPWPELLAERQTARDLFVALTMCGGRWGEVSRLAVDQVIEADGVVRVRLYGWKTDKERLVPAPPMMAEMLARRVAEAKAGGSRYLFPRQRNGTVGQQSPEQAWVRGGRSIRKAMDRAGLNEAHIVERQGRATIHSLRHTFASWLRQAGVSLAEIQELLGHEAEAMTKRYAHVAKHATVDLASGVITRIVSQALQAPQAPAQ